MTDEDAVAEDEQYGEYHKWVDEITLYDTEANKWMERGKKIVRRFKDERDGAVQKRGARYNVLWSNVQTMSPAIYDNPPKPNIERRSRDQDDVGRIASEVLERSASYFIDKDNFDSIMRQVVQDRLLPGRGTAWIRYVPHFIPSTTEGQPEQLDYEEVCLDYVHWKDFGHSVAMVWEEVDSVWRIAYMERDALVARFGEELGNEIPLDHNPRKLDGNAQKQNVNKAAIYEIWCKKTKKVYWLSRSYDKILDMRDDPLGLENFFPCPKPIYATLATDSLIPIPDYYEYQDQANEMDELTARISQITKAVKVAGVYDSSAQGVNRLLAEGVENQLIPVEQWAMFGEKGGLKGVIDFLPMQEIMETLLGLYQAREKVKGDLNEITGMSDIIRGNTDPDETATAQRMKGQYANLRLANSQKDVARFGRDLVRIIVEIMAEHFSLETIKNISGVKLLTDMEKQMMLMQQQQMQAPVQPGMPTPPPPPSDEQQELLDGPTWEQVEALLRNNEIRSYRIDIETDSTIKADEEAEKAARMDFLKAAGGFIQQASQIQSPELRPLLMQMLMFGVRGFKAAREIEGEFEVTMKKLRTAADNPQPPAPDSMVEVEKAKNATELQAIQAQQAQKDQDNQTQLQIAQLDAESKLKVAQLDSQATIEAERLRVQQETIKATFAARNNGEKDEKPEISEETMPDHKVINYDFMGNRA